MSPKGVFRFFQKVPYYQKFLEHPPYINCVPASEFSLENVKIKMKLVVKYNLLKYADKVLIIENLRTYYLYTDFFGSQSP